MDDSLSVTSVRDPYSFVTRFVKLLEGGIHSNTFSKRGKRQSVEVKRFLDAAATNELQPFVSSFAISLLRTLQQCVRATHASDARCREKSYVAFYQAQLGSIPDLWIKVHRDLSLPPPDPLWPQTTSRLMFEDMLVETLKGKHLQGRVPALKEHQQLHMAADQENVLRYAAGFVPYKLLRKYKQKDTEEAGAIVDCLVEMAVSGEDSSFLEYTAEWTKAINRGGLFEVNNVSYLFFRAMEGQVSTMLRTLTIGSTVSEADVLASVCSNEDVLFHWDLLTGALNTETGSILLQEFAQLWLTIRAHAYTRMVLEEHKHDKQVTTAKAKALRASLKKSDSKKT